MKRKLRSGKDHYHVSEDKFHRRWFDPLPGRRPAREGGQRHYPTDLLRLIEMDERSGCWIWRGTLHSLGHPIYKGWLSARRVVFEKFCRLLEPGERIGGRLITCHDTRCVCPWHQLIIKRGERMSDARKSAWVPPEQRESSESGDVDISDLEFLDTMGRIGRGLMLNSLPFASAQNLIKYGYLKAVPESTTIARLELTEKGLLMVEARKAIKRGNGA